jgi:hypothetical protein
MGKPANGAVFDNALAITPIWAKLQDLGQKACPTEPQPASVDRARLTPDD